MKSTLINTVHLEGLLYEHKLEAKVSGPNSKTPGTPFISGTISIATDEDCLNVVPVHYTYVTEKTFKGNINPAYTTLKNICDGVLKSVMGDGKEKATKLRVDSSIGLNEFFSNRTGQEELVSVKRNEGGFVHVADTLAEKETTRNRFDCDIIITGARRVEANEEKNIPEKVIVKGAIFDFRKALLPVELTAIHPGAMDYFKGLEASEKNPVFTKVWGRQVSETTVREIEEESAFGEPTVKEVRSSYKDYIITAANPVPYEWGDTSTFTNEELMKAISDRNTYVATIKQRQDEYNQSKAAANANVSAPAAGEFKF